MSIEARYNYLGAHADHPTALPEWPAVRYLERVLDEVAGLYFDVEWQAFREEGGDIYVRVALDLGDRPMYLSIHDEGLTLKLEVPVWHSLPSHACSFVLTTLCRRYSSFSFHLDAGSADVLIAHAQFDIDASLEDLPMLLPYIARQVAQSVEEVRAHLSAVN